MRLTTIKHEALAGPLTKRPTQQPRQKSMGELGRPSQQGPGLPVDCGRDGWEGGGLARHVPDSPAGGQPISLLPSLPPTPRPAAPPCSASLGAKALALQSKKARKVRAEPQKMRSLSHLYVETGAQGLCTGSLACLQRGR